MLPFVFFVLTEYQSQLLQPVFITETNRTAPMFNGTRRQKL